VNILLDTHIALWAIADSPRLPPRARELIASPDNAIWVSAASVWEIAIKHALGRGDMPVSGREAQDWFLQSGYRLLPIKAEHAAAVEDLPAHHSDPFDRILIAQALTEPMRLLTHDALVALYGDAIIRV
jgi:PIN domain nuclease of toxin-antitoxin system